MAFRELHMRFLRNQALLLPADTVEDAADRMLGIRGAEGSTPYLSLLWRVRDFQPDDFDAAVHQSRRLLRVRGPRGTYYWVTLRQAPIFIAACKPSFLSAVLAPWGMTESEYLAIRDEVLGSLSGGSLRTLRELTRSVPTRLQHPVSKRGAPPTGSLRVALEVMQSVGELTALKEPGFHRHRVDEYHGDQRDVTRPNRYGLIAELYPRVSADPAEPAEARRQLLWAYIRTYGPVTMDDMAWWTGWNRGVVNELLRELQPNVQEVSLKGVAQPYWHAADQEMAETDGAGAVHLLPGGDSAIKAYDNFDRLLHDSCPDENLLRFNPVLLFGGVGRGNWAYRRTPECVDVVLSLFDQPSPVDRAALEEAAHRLGAFVADAAGQEVRAHLTTRSAPWRAADPFPPLP